MSWRSIAWTGDVPHELAVYCRNGGAVGAPLYGLVEQFYEEVEVRWEERFEPACGHWRDFVDDVL
jgi:hypothetical protein